MRERLGTLEADKENLRLERDRLLRMLEQQAEQMRLLSEGGGPAGSCAGCSVVRGRPARRQAAARLRLRSAGGCDSGTPYKPEPERCTAGKHLQPPRETIAAPWSTNNEHIRPRIQPVRT